MKFKGILVTINRVRTASAHKNSRNFPFLGFSRTKYCKSVSDFHRNRFHRSRFLGLSRTYIRIPGLSWPGKQFFEILDFPGFPGPVRTLNKVVQFPY